MKIGIILESEFPPEPRLENVAKQLINNGGYDIHVFCLNFNARPTREKINQLFVYRYNFPRKLYNKLGPLAYTFPIYHWVMKVKIKRFIKEINPDVLHVHDMVVAKSVFDLKLSIPTILDLHENRPEIMKTYTHVSEGIGKYLIDLKKWKKYEYSFINKCDWLILVTQEAKNDYLKNIPSLKEEKVICAPNTIDLELFLNHKTNNEIIKKYKNHFTILYLGVIAIRRGLKTVIQAISFLKDEIPNFKFVIVGGESRDTSTLKKTAVKLGVKNNVIFEGWQNVNLFPSYIKATDIGICPFERNIHHDTTFANKLFQHMGAGQPVIVSDCPPQKRVIEEEKCGLVFKGGNVNDLVSKIKIMYNNPEKRKQMGQNGKNAVQEKYNWNKTGKDLINLYESLKSGE